MNSDIFVQAMDAGRTYMHKGNRVRALIDATCSVKPHDRIAVMGPSGSGKSTLIHLIGGIDIPSEGDVFWPAFGGRDKLRPGNIGIVFQMPSLIPSLSIIENVELPLLLTGSDKKGAIKRAGDIFEKFELSELKEKLPEELSGGQLQRVALARAMVTGPKLLLADEPTGQLDHPTAQHLFSVLLDYLEGSDTALVVATHDRAVSVLMDKVWKINHGVMEAENVI